MTRRAARASCPTTDGHRYVAFVSDADGLSDADDDRVSNVFVRDRQLNLTILVSRADGPGGAGANGSSAEPSITADGRWVAFHSRATNLAAGASGSVEHVYVRDLVDGTTQLVDRADGSDGAIANGGSLDPSITASGNNPVVAFASGANNLDGADERLRRQVYVRRFASDDTADGQPAERLDRRSPATGRRATRRSRPTRRASRSSHRRPISSRSTGRRRRRVHPHARHRRRGGGEPFPAGTPATRASPSLSANGNRVAFTLRRRTSTVGRHRHRARRLRDPDLPDRARARQPCERVRPATRATGRSAQPAISDDGNAVVFTSARAPISPRPTRTASRTCSCAPPPSPRRRRPA